MADHEESKLEAMVEKIVEKIHPHDSSSSDSDDDKSSTISSLKSKVFRLFGREKPVHKVFGGGKPADILLWRDKKISAAILGSVTAVWALFEVFEYNLLTLICHVLILTIAVLFLWTNASTFINKDPPAIPKVHIPEAPVLDIASALRFEINRGFASLREIALGRDLKKFLAVRFLLLHTLPVLYEKYEDQADAFAEKAMIEIKKQYAVLDEKVLSKIPRGPLKDKKLA
ncbi:hypothetical protein Cgig2_031541 [Carnegiea gigantea]|uniref:Reticulon-like protein n=1 Tax=Carnegiea gigantea TaxID=171969 RepID=A0A9Q1K549_9CARY|nr:hypothetical protein Cgig2_031541 [Carnegiea gigantea]